MHRFSIKPEPEKIAFNVFLGIQTLHAIHNQSMSFESFSLIVMNAPQFSYILWPGLLCQQWATLERQLVSNKRDSHGYTIN